MPKAGNGAAARRAVLTAGFGIGALGLALALRDGVPQLRVAVSFAVLVLAGELLRVNLPGDRDSSPIGGAAALAYSLLVVLQNGVPAAHGVAAVVAVVFVASIASALIHEALQRDARTTDLARRILATAAAAAAFRLVLAGSPLARVVVGRQKDQPLLAMAVAALAAIAVDLMLSAVVDATRKRAPFAPILRNETTAQAPLALATAATGILMALSVRVMGLWALLVFCVPLLVTQFSFRRFASIATTYRQTIRALSRVTEVGGYVEPGHARRVMSLSVAVGREFGMNDAELLDLEYAALMHDIGQLSLADPIPRGSTLTVAPSERRRIAELGAEVIRTTGTLDRVAHIVEAQASPYRKMRENADVDVPLAARVVKACSAYDDLVSASRESRGTRASWDALERLRMGMAFEYDPRVVEALTRVLDKAGDL
ncbi:MAG TPA: HD domain-containing phosphohydrolase [Mycobacteriales bacterium]|nr:HD domain-containing phosphohydrolase [Mycobacteriales bacterium]